MKRNENKEHGYEYYKAIKARLNTQIHNTLLY